HGQQNRAVESNLPGALGMHEQLRVVKPFLLSDTPIVSPALINEFRFGVSFNTNPQTAASIDGPAFIRAAGLTNVTRTGDLPPVKQLPVVGFAQGPGVQSIEVTNQRFFNEDLTVQGQDTVSKIAGKHSLRIGFEVNQRKFKDQNQPTNVFGSFTFTNRYTGFNFADFLLGIPSTISRAPYAEQREDRSIAYDW